MGDHRTARAPFQIDADASLMLGSNQSSAVAEASESWIMSAGNSMCRVSFSSVRPVLPTICRR